MICRSHANFLVICKFTEVTFFELEPRIDEKHYKQLKGQLREEPAKKARKVERIKEARST